MKYIEGTVIPLHIAKRERCRFCMRSTEDHDERECRDQVIADYPGFTAQQMVWLNAMLMPQCCHVTGMHDPLHGFEGRGVCEFQLMDIVKNLAEALDLSHLLKSEHVLGKTGCGWCASRWVEVESHQRVEEWRQSNSTDCPFGHGPMHYYPGKDPHSRHGGGFFRCNMDVEWKTERPGLAPICGWRLNVPIDVLQPDVIGRRSDGSWVRSE